MTHRLRQLRHRPAFGNGLTIGLFGLAALIFVQFAPFTGATVGAVDITTYQTSPYLEGRERFEPSQNPLQVDQVDGIALAATFWREVQQGDLRMWEPNLGTGAPLGGVLYTRVWSPFYWIGAIVPAESLSSFAAWLALWSAQVGAWLLARRLDIGRHGAFLTGLAYGFSGTTLALLFRINEVSLAPWVLLGVHAVVSRRSRNPVMPVVGLTVATALTWLCGFPAASLFIIYAAAAVAVIAALLEVGPHLKMLFGRLLPAAAGVIGGTLLASPLILPSLEFLSASESLDRSYSSDHVAGFEMFGTAASGRILGTYQFGDWWWPDRGYTNPVVASITIGAVVVLLLAIGALASRRVRPHPRAMTWVGRVYLPLGAVVFIGTFLGGPILAAIQLLPYMGSNDFGRSRFLLVLALALAAGVVLDGLVRRRDGAGKLDLPFRLQIGAAAVAAIWSTGLVVAGSIDTGYLDRALRGLTVPSICLAVAAIALVSLMLRGHLATVRWVSVAVIAIALTVELQWGLWGFTPIVDHQEGFYPDHPALEVMEPAVSTEPYRFTGTAINVVRPNSAAYLELTDLRISNPSYERYRQLMRAFDPGVFDRARLRTWFTDDFDPSSPVLTRSAVRYIVAPASDGVLESAPWAMVEVSDDGVIEIPASSTPARALSFPVDGVCLEGFLTVRSEDQIVGRRPLWQVEPGEFIVPLEDVVGPARLQVETTGCAIDLHNEVVIHRASEDTAMRLVWADEAIVYARSEALPRFHLASEVRGMSDPDTKLEYLVTSDDTDTTILDDSTPPTELGGGTVEVTADTGDHLTLEVQSRGEGLLVVRDANGPGWKATIDGEAVPIEHADHAFRAISVPDGESTVRMYYLPDTRLVGFTLAATTVLGLLVAQVTVRWRRRQSTKVRQL